MNINSGFIDTFHKAYKRLFSLDEISNDLAVRLFGAAVLLGFIASFKSWDENIATSIHGAEKGLTLCWPFLQQCYDWVFMTARPFGYVQNTVFMGMLGLIFTSAYGLCVKRYTLAHICIFILFIFKLYLLSISYRYNANYDYYQTVFTFIFLFVPNKRFFASLSIVFFYFLSTATKIHESWSLGGYFSAMVTDLPIFPEGTTMVWTNTVIFMEMIGSWFLFSKNKYIQRTVFAFFAIFHLYSGTLVGYHYPTIVTPTLLIFFGPLFKPFDRVPLSIKSIPGWILMTSLFCFQMISHAIPGDEKLTLEGNFYGLYMFEANHQCSIRFFDDKGNTKFSRDSTSARSRCDPYRYLNRFQKNNCKPDNKNKYTFKMTHSINGGPFYLIVDEPDACSLKYKAFTHNEWIKTEEEAKPIARPRKNFYK